MLQQTLKLLQREVSMIKNPCKYLVLYLSFFSPGHVAQSVMYLAKDVSLTADPGSRS